MPFDALVQFEGQLFAILVPGPAGGQIGHDRLHAVLLYVLVVHDEVVENPHHGAHRVNRHLLVDRHAGRAVDRIGFENTTLLLGKCPVGRRHRNEPYGNRRERAQFSRHSRLLAGSVRGFSRVAPDSLFLALSRVFRLRPPEP